MAEIQGASAFASRLRKGMVAGATAAMILSPFAANAQQATKVATGGKIGPSAIELQDAQRITGKTDCAKFRLPRAAMPNDGTLCEHFKGQALERENAALKGDIKQEKVINSCLLTIKAAYDRGDVSSDMVRKYGRDGACALVRDLKLQ